MPSSVLHNQSPYFRLFGHHPNLASLRIFGFICYNRITAKCVISRHVLHDEAVFPFKQINPGICRQSSQFSSPASVAPVIFSLPSRLSQASLNSQDPSSLASDTQVSTSQSQSISSTPGSLSPIQHQASLDEQQLQAMFPFEVSDVSSSSVSTPDSLVSLFTINDHPMITRSKSGIVQNKEFPDYQGYFTYLHAIPELDEPSSFRVASFSSEWRQAMKEEIDALHIQDTWILVPSPGDKNIIGSKWVYKIKRNPDGSVGRYKARLVAQRFSQEPSFDFGETFSPVVRHTTVRLVLSIAAMNQWKLRQLDVKNAFLQGDLEEEVFMKQPPGFEDFTHPQFHTGNDIIILLRYVDNIIITGSSDQLIQRVVTNLSEVFEMKDMGQLTVFLGLQISYNSFGDIERTRPEFSKTRGKSCGIPDITSMSGLTY
ncbi:hypothetical protein L3X38_020072 [Prunus dulcis]|uniref:Reverse transcriptase Ty1/copia-type domain-containing protein n=1 Tax=Prunus dulcis TaxID=3755 RepID=A0AAD4WD35_PRUDU|nr:hypothetical protein L3X38_020072 [Prunus dulcis]